MVDLSTTIEPKSDQTNADDLVGGPRTIKITRVSKGSADQPITINFEGDNGRPYKPCKSMRRLLVKLWGKDGDQYVGRSLTLFCDPTVTFGGDAVGGIRISHLSHIEQDETLMLTVTRGKKKPYQVRKLREPGDIESARKALEAATAETLEDLLAGLRESSWSKSEQQEIKKLAGNVRARHVEDDHDPETGEVA